ncbi:MAG: GAF domain-containing protein [Chloroflexi bacterium]|nr:MAG: GAF domain-containing protein [Chloroflexota bacterium]
MATKPNVNQTQLLRLQNDELGNKEDMQFRAVPFSELPDSQVPVWRVWLEPGLDATQGFGLELNGEVVLGRGTSEDGVVDLTPYGAEALGVSRQHLMLRPTATNLYVIDLESTNGTWKNGRSIGIKTPYPLNDGDILTLGRLNLSVRIIRRPAIQTAPLDQPIDLAEAIHQIAQAITSQLDLDEVLNQVAATAMTLTSAGETGIWLVDEGSGELFLEAARGVKDERVRRMRLALREGSLVSQVITTGKPVRVSQRPGEEKLKVTTGYLVEALVYVPIKLGGVTFGVLSAVHRIPGKQFTSRDEQLLTMIADFAAIAIQNARLFQATDLALAKRIRQLATLNEVSHAVSASLDLNKVYHVLKEEIAKHCPVSAIKLYLLDQKSQLLRPFSAGTTTSLKEAIPIGKGIIGQVAQTGKTIVSNHVMDHVDYDPQTDVRNGQPIHSIACIPLLVRERVLGVLALMNREDGRFTEDDIDLLEAFASPVATAIENARLFTEAEQRRIAIQATAQAFTHPLLLLDPEGNVLVANQAAQQLLDSHMSQLFDAISRGVGRTIEIVIGEKTYLSTVEHVPSMGTIVVMQDITYVKQLEGARSEFVHMLSHDLKNPLMAVMGWAGVLERVVELDDKGKRYIGEIENAAERMLGMVNQLLLTLADDEEVVDARMPCVLREIVASVLDDVQGAALHKQIELSMVEEGEPYTVLGDKTRLYHLVLNLVDNAIKYSPPQTKVTVGLQFSREKVILRVQDEGPGIPEEDLERIFDKFYRSVHKNLESGSGVGLAAVRAIAQAHGGDVQALNRPEGGAEFVVTLPGSLRVGG